MDEELIALTELLKKLLLKEPEHALLSPDGLVLAALAGPDQEVLVITAPPGENFLGMSDEVINEILCRTIDKNLNVIDINTYRKES